ncbi:MAG: glycosyltransferase family 2 protein [Nitrospiria bacterium]
MKPLISICMPTRNVAEYLPDCIRSIEAQTYKNWELIIVNDGSTDSTAKLLDYYDRKIKQLTVVTIPPSGIARARNTAIKVAKGDYIAVMDSDDIMYRGRLREALKILTKTRADVFYSAYYRGDEEMKIIDGIIPPRRFSKEKTRLEEILKEQLIPHVTVVAKRQCFIDKPYRDELKVNDDMALVLDWWSAGYKFCMSKHPLVLVRFHDRSTSVTKNKEVRTITEKLRKEFS